MPVINATIDGVAVEIEEGCTGLQHYASRGDVVAMTVDGKAWDLSREIPSGATVDAITLNSPEGLEILRHSCTHVMAQAVQEVFPDVNLGIGPFITDGFYYDFGNIDSVSP